MALTGGALLGGMAASRGTVTVTPGSPEEWAQEPGLMQASIRLPKARTWLRSMLGWGGCSQCRQGTCNGSLPGHCPERASSASPKQEGWGPGPQMHGIDPPPHDITGRNIFSEAQLLLALSKLRPKASGGNSRPYLPQHTAHTPRLSHLLPAQHPTLCTCHAKYCPLSASTHPSRYRYHHLYKVFLYFPLPQEVGAFSLTEFPSPNTIFYPFICLIKQ